MRMSWTSSQDTDDDNDDRNEPNRAKGKISLR